MTGNAAYPNIIIQKIKMNKDNKIEHYPKKVGFKPGAKKFPLMVVLSVSNVCNCKCVHCPFSNNPELRQREGNPFMSKELFLKIFKECKNKNTFIRITGTGEPFMVPYLGDALLEGKKQGLKIGIITNGSLLTPKIAKLMLDAGFDVLEISADAADKKTYEKIRVGLKFGTILENIDFMIKYRNKIKGKTKIIVSIVDQPDRVDVEAAEKFWGKKVDNVIIRKWLTYGKMEEERYSKQTYLDPKNRIACPYPFERMVVLSNGKVTFCNFDVDLNDGYYMGDLNYQSIKEVWRSKKFDEWRELVKKKQFEKVPLCAKCSDWKYKSWSYNYFKAKKDAEKKRTLKRKKGG